MESKNNNLAIMRLNILTFRSSKPFLWGVLVTILLIAGVFINTIPANAVELSDEDAFAAATNLNQAYCFTTPAPSGASITFSAGSLSWGNTSCLDIFKSDNNNFGAGYDQVRANGCYLVSGFGSLQPCQRPGASNNEAGLLAIDALRRETGDSNAGSASGDQASFEDPAIVSEDSVGGAGGADAPDPTTTTGSSDLDEWFQTVINLLSLIVGIVITASIIIAGYQYMTARDNANQVSDAKQRIAISVVCLIFFAFAYVILQWLIPGGIFSS